MRRFQTIKIAYASLRFDVKHVHAIFIPHGDRELGTVIISLLHVRLSDFPKVTQLVC